MTWGELKALAEKDGVKDDTLINLHLYEHEEIEDLNHVLVNNRWEVE